LNQTFMSSKSERVVFTSPPTIEHIIPQSWVANWPLPDGSKGIDLFELLLLDASATDPRVAASLKRERAVQTLGNLTILSSGLNSAQSNLSWDQKRPEMMKHSMLPINQSLLETTVWDETAILNRGEELFSRALQIWGRSQESRLPEFNMAVGANPPPHTGATAPTLQEQDELIQNTAEVGVGPLLTDVIRLLVKENPKLTASKIWKRFELYRDGMSVGDCIAAIDKLYGGYEAGRAKDDKDLLEFLDNMKDWWPVGVGQASADPAELAETVIEETVRRIRAYVEWRSEMPLPGDVAYRADEALPVNGWSLNLAAKRWLRQVPDSPTDPTQPYLVQLLHLGFDRQLSIPGPGEDRRWEIEQEAGQLLHRNLDPVRLTHWFVNNPDGGEEGEQNDTLLLRLEEANDWEEAAQNLMEWFYDRISAENPYYR
jgi:Protein of unknown function (DUF1524)